MSTTLATLLADFVAEYSVGRAGIATANGTTTTVIDATRFGSTAMAAQDWSRGSSIRFTGVSAGVAGQVAFLTAYDPSTGTITFSPAVANAPQSGDTFVIAHRHMIDNVDRVVEAINRGLLRWVARWTKVPFTAIVGGDLLGTTADWTPNNASVSYVDQAIQDNPWFQRYATVASSGINGYAAPAQNMQVTAGDVIEFSVPIRETPTGSAGVPTIVVQDSTNNAAIAVTYSAGASTNASRVWLNCQGTFTVPAGCDRVSFRIGGIGNLTHCDFGPLIVQSTNAQQFVAQSHLLVPKYLGNFHQFIPGADPGQPTWGTFRELPIRGTIEQQGNGLFTVTFSEPPPFPLYYDEYFSGSVLALDTDTTIFDEELVLKAAAYEFFRTADLTERRTNQNIILRGRRVSVSRFEADLQNAQQALKEAIAELGQETRLVRRRSYEGVASG